MDGWGEERADFEVEEQLRQLHEQGFLSTFPPAQPHPRGWYYRLTPRGEQLLLDAAANLQVDQPSKEVGDGGREDRDEAGEHQAGQS